MTAFDQAWALLKSDNPSDSLVDEEWHNPNRSFYSPTEDTVNLGQKHIWNQSKEMNVNQDIIESLNPESAQENSEKIFAEAPGNMFGRVAAHEYGHAVTNDEVENFMEEKGRTDEYGSDPAATAAHEYGAYAMQFPESGYLATKNMLRQVINQVSHNLSRKQKKGREDAGMWEWGGYDPDNHAKAKERVMAELPDHIRSLHSVVQQAGRKGESLKEKEQAYREMMGARAREPMLRRQTISPHQWPGKIEAARDAQRETLWAHHRNS
tara:strand:- start:1118 stop:1915 length:798 start_codon:yes stop_codon:yes gene_type:complete